MIGRNGPRFTLEEVLSATGGDLVGGVSEAVFDGISTDSRRVPAGALFVGLVGERFDGADFASQAVSGGAAGVVVAAARAGETAQRVPETIVIGVDDPTRALGLLARLHRRRSAARIVAVTGSNGKTTTKEMLRSVLSEAGSTLATEGNLNNEIGAPLTLFGLRPEHRFCVAEIGMNHEGEISRLTAIVEPQVGVVTNAAAVHVEALGSVENVSRAKGELYNGLALDAVAVANADDPLMTERARWAGRRTVWFGASDRADVRLLGIDSHDARGLALRLAFRGRAHRVTLPMVGLHNALNACAAFAAAVALGVDEQAIVRGLGRARAPGRRLRLTPIPGALATILDDCYNANPASMVAALRTLCELAPEGHRLAVLGDMRELGADEAAAHREIGRAAAQSGLKLLVAFGSASRDLAEGAREAGMPAAGVVHTEDPAEAAERVRAVLGEGDLVLVKASRGTRLERVSDLLAPPGAEASS